MDELSFDELLDQEVGPKVSSDLEKQVSVADGIPGKSTQNIVSWVEIMTHSNEDAESLVTKLKTASINYPDLKIKQVGKQVIAQVKPITVEIPYLNGVIKVASEHGVTNIGKKFQVVDVK